MSNSTDYTNAPKQAAAEAAIRMREAAQMAKVFEPSELEIDDAKRHAWNKSIHALRQFLPLEPTVIQPHRNMAEYTVSSGGFIEGPAYIGKTKYYLTVRFNPDFISPEFLPQDEPQEMYTPVIFELGKHNEPFSYLYDSMAEALEEYSCTGEMHKDALSWDSPVLERMPTKPSPLLNRWSRFTNIFKRNK